MSMRVAVACDKHNANEARVQQLANKLDLPLCHKSQLADSVCHEHDYHLQLSTSTQDTHLELSATDQAIGNPLYIDFVMGSLAHRRQYGGGRGQPLARAIGLKGGINPVVVDATAGTGRDAFVLASLGASVILIERSPVLYALLEDALIRAQRNEQTAPIVQRMQLVMADAKHWLADCSSSRRPDVIYMDPMYPHRSKSALVKKEMRMLRALVGDDEDADGLLLAALGCARKRVVVKRPKGAPIIQGIGLENITPASAVESKNTRYDLYPIL